MNSANGLIFLLSVDNPAGCIAVILIVGAAAVFLIWNSNQKQKEIERAREAYQQALQHLRQNPTNARARQRALDLGRTYSNLTRNRKGVTVYDEMAIMNDINAATAGAVTSDQQLVSKHAAPPQSPPSTTIETRLAQLEVLASKNLISRNEYKEKRKAILDEL